MYDFTLSQHDSRKDEAKLIVKWGRKITGLFKKSAGLQIILIFNRS